MSVYVDDMEAKFGRMIMSHMVADEREELLSMANAIGVDTKWIQNEGTGNEHFDICQSKRAQAIKLGAVTVTRKELARVVIRKALRRKKALDELTQLSQDMGMYE